MTARRTPHTTLTVESGIRPRKGPLVMLEFLALCALAVLLVAAACAGTDSRTVDRTTQHRVEAGDTLWSLARGIRTPGQTTEEAMQVIADLNGIDHATLQVGTTLQLPADTTMSTAQAMR